MNSATKFDSFKQSLASMGRNSQAQVVQAPQTSPTNEIQNAEYMSGYRNTSQYMGGNIPSSGLQNNNVESPSMQYQSNVYPNSNTIQTSQRYQ